MEVIAGIISGLLPKLTEFIKEQSDLHNNIGIDFEDIKTELECMEKFLQSADAAEEEHEDMDTWVSQVRAAACKAEDIIEEFIFRFSYDHKSRFLGSVTDWFSKRNMASRMHDLKAKFKAIEESNARYQKRDFQPIVSTSAASEQQQWHNPQRDVLIPSQDGLFGVETHENNLKTMLSNFTDTHHNLISVVGMGGVGKSCLVKKVFDSAEAKNQFQGRVWITVSQKFKADDILFDLIQKLHQVDSVKREPEEEGIHMLARQKTHTQMSREEMHKKIRTLLEQTTHLVVFDDVWTISDWNSIQIAVQNMSSDSKVMITTRNENTAMAACKARVDLVYHLKPLSYQDSYDLFCTKIFGSSSSCPDHLKDVAKKMVRRCAGVPLAIVVTAGILLSKDPMAQADEWGRVDSSLEEGFKGVHGVLSLSYNILPIYLKPCFLYMSIFPQNHTIRRMRLIRLWIATGQVQRKSNLTLEEVAEIYLDELVTRNLVEVVERTSSGKVEQCRIHSLIWEMIMNKAVKHQFAAFAIDDNFLAMRHLSLSSDSELIQKLKWHRSLIIFNVNQTVDSKQALFSTTVKFKMLSVLDLQDSNLDKFPKIIKGLVYLKYLNLSHTDVKTVPKWIGNLRMLETLDLRCTLVTKLPEEILKLQSLRDLLVYRVENDKISGVTVPEGIQYISSLESLLILDGGRSFRKTAEKVPQLRRLGVRNLNSKNAEDIFSFISKLSQLQVLSLSSSESEVWDMDLERLESPSSSLRLLYVTGKLASVPKWLETMSNLTTIYLTSSKLHDDPVEIIGQLPNLMHVELSDVFDKVELCFKTGRFKRLRMLGISRFIQLQKIIFEDESMENLEQLKLNNCGLMKTLPAGIENLSKLTEVSCVDMPAELKTDIQSTGRIKHVKVLNWLAQPAYNLTADQRRSWVEYRYNIDSEHYFANMGEVVWKSNSGSS